MGRKLITLEDRVFPLIALVEGSAETSGSGGHYLGTCFLIQIGPQHVFVSAGHTTSGLKSDAPLFLGFNARGAGQSTLKVEALHVHHLSQDVAFFLPTARMKLSYQELLTPTSVIWELLTVGQKVIVFGFPNSSQFDALANVPEMLIQRGRFDGEVVTVETDCPTPPMRNVYYLSGRAPAGLSGSPVLVERQGTLCVAGFIIGEKCTTNGEGRPIG
jgi:hypothetical protein